VREQPRTLSEAERTAIRRLATDIPALWAASTTTDADRKELIRQVVERVVVEAERSSERVHVRIVWVGSGQTTGTITRPIRHVTQLSTYAELCEQVRTWTLAGLPAIRIAEQLNAAGYRTTRGQVFGVQAVHDLRRRLELRGHRPCPRSRTELAADEYWATTLARILGLPKTTLEHWIRSGWVRARQEPTGLRRWIVWADAAEQARLRQFHHRPTRDEIRHHWLQQKEMHHAPTP
jgi:hypothetical protein